MKILRLLKRLWQHISFRRRKQFASLLTLMLLASFAEIFSIGAIFPFLLVLTSPDRFFNNSAAKTIADFFNITTSEQLLFPLTITFSLAVLFAGGLRLLLIWATTRLSFATGAELSMSIYHRTLYQPYEVHCARNSSDIINGISGKANAVIYNTIVPALTFISSSMMLIVILVALLTVEPMIALSAFGGFSLIYIVIISLTRKKLLHDSQCIARESSRVIKSLQEGLGGIRDVLIDGSQSTFCNIYSNADLALRRAQGSNLFVSSSPRYAMEALGMLLICGLAFSMAQQTNGISKAIPILGALALSAQRLLPILQQAYGSWVQMKGGQASLEDAIQLLEQPLPEFANKSAVEPISFNRSICLDNVSFRYQCESPFALKKINLTFPKGERVGFIGATGCGKSTLLDIVMGLLQPTEGNLVIDGQPITSSNNRSWQAHIAHVPQAIFLADATIQENIAFGVSKDQINYQRVYEAAKKAQIFEIVDSFPDKFNTVVGERGVRLSGGQRQRIGIARALYKQANVIIFDEATSALDNETEKAVMEAIEDLSAELTILIIAHRLSTLKKCTQIVEMVDGCVGRVGSYAEIINSANTL